ncbi:MAG: hypothetical protein ACYC0C_12735 [Devosia sp.]
MSISHAKSHTDPQRLSRNWLADTLIVAGILAFGYFAIMLETSPQPWSGTTQQMSDFPLELTP